MSTKAQDFRNEMQRTRHEDPKKKPVHRAMDPKHTDSRNVTKRIDKQVGMVLEDSMSGRPSRKSSRKSSHGGRPDGELMRAARSRSQTPKAQAARAQTARR